MRSGSARYNNTMKTTDLNTFEILFLADAYQHLLELTPDIDIDSDMVRGMTIDPDDSASLIPLPVSVETATYLKENPDGRVFDLLQNCYRICQRSSQSRRSRLEEIVGEWPQKEKNAVTALLDVDEWPVSYQEEDHFIIQLAKTQLFETRLVFEGAQSDIPADCPGLYCGFLEIAKEDGRITLKVEIMDPLSSQGKIYHLNADDMRVCLDVYNGMINRPLFGEPWSYLLGFFSELKLKCQSAELNERERQLLPLAEELLLLCDEEAHSSSHQKNTYPLFRQLLGEYKASQIIRKLDKIESHFSDDIINSTRAELLLTTEMNDREYYPVWKHLCDLAVLSQQEYPVRYENDGQLTADEVLRENGFTFTGEDYRMTRKLKGLHYIKSDSISDVITGKVEHHVFLIRTAEGLQINGCTITEPKKNISYPDFFSTLFYVYPLNHYLSYTYCYQDGQFDRQQFTEFLNCALSCFRLEKLSADQRSVLGIEAAEKERFDLGTSVLISVVGTLFIYAVMAVISYLILLVFGAAPDFWSLIQENAYGIPLGILAGVAVFYLSYLFSQKNSY